MRRLLQFLHRFFAPTRRKARRQSRPLIERLEPYVLISGTPLNIVLIDSALADSSFLRNAVSSSAVVITYDRSKMSADMVLQQAVQQAIAKNAPIASLTLLSHGTPGGFALGSDLITEQTLSLTVPAWQDLAAHFTSDAKVYIFGCRVVEEGSSGQGLIDKLSALTNASVYASTNITGKGGDWTLEASSANALPLNPALIPLDTARLQDYQGQLVWIGATSGSTNDASHNYTNTANWQGGTIDDSFSGVALAGNLTLYMSAARTSTGMNFGYSGAYGLTLESSSSTAQTLTLNGGISGNFAGTSAGTVTIGNATNPVTIAAASVQTFTVTGSTDTLDIVNAASGAGGITLAGAGTLILEGNNTYTGNTTVGAGTLQIGNGTSGSIAGLLTDNAAVIFNRSDNNGLSYGQTITGSGTIQITGGGSMLLNGDSNGTFTGSTSITNNSRLELDARSVGYNQTITVASGSSLYLNGTAVTYYNNISIAGVGWASETGAGAAGALRLRGNSSLFGNVTLTADATISAYKSLGRITGNIAGGSYNLTLSQAGQTSSTGKLTLTGTNTYASLTIGLGTQVVLGGANALSTSGIIMDGGELDLSGYSFSLANLSSTANGGNITDSNSTAVTLTVGSDNTSTSYSGILADGSSGILSLVKVGTGGLALAGTSTYTGGTTLSAGVLDLNNASAIGTGTFTIGGGTLDNTSGGAITLSTNNVQTWSANFAYGGTNDLNLGTGTPTFTANRTITVNGTANLTVGGNISGGTNALAVVGPGEMILSGTNSFSGGLNIDNALQTTTTVVAASNGALGSGTVTIGTSGNNTGAQLALMGGVTISTPITLNARANTSPGIESLSGANTIASTLSLQIGGTYYPIQVDSGSNLTFSAANSINVAAASSTRTLVLLGAGTGTISGTITEGSSTAGIVANQTGTWNLKGNGVFSGPVVLNAGTTSFASGALGNGTITFGGNSTLQWSGTNTQDVSSRIQAIPTGVNGTIDTNANNVTFASAISGAGGLSKSGTGNLTLSVASTLSGGVTMNAGGLNIGNAGALGTGTFTINGGTIDNKIGSTATLSGNVAMVWGGSFSFTGTNSLDLGTGTVTLTAGPTVTVTAGTLTVGGAITGSQSLTKAGSGTLTLSGTGSNYSGVTALNAGQLNINAAAAIGLGGLTIAAGTTLDNTSGSAVALGNKAITINGSFTFAGSNDLSLGTSGTTLGASATITVSAGNLSFPNVISGLFGITKAGAGTLVLSGANTYTAGTTLSAGLLDINNATAIGTGAFTISGGTIDNTSGGAITLSTNNAQTWSGDFTFTGTNDLNLGTGAVTMGASRSLTFNGGNLTVGGNIAGGANALTTQGVGRLILSGTNTLGSVTIGTGSGGSTLRATASGALGTGTVTLHGNGFLGVLELTGGITIANAISFQGHTSGRAGIESVSGSNTLSSTMTISLGGSFYPLQVDSGATLTLSAATSITNSQVGSRIIQLQGAGTGTISGIIQDTTSNVSLSVSGTATWTLSGANTFTNGTTLNSGATLNINNAGAIGTGTFTINGGTVDNTSGGVIALTNNNVEAWNGNFTFTGSNALNLGTGAVTLSGNRQITTTAGTLTAGGAVGDGGSAYSIKKMGAGTLALGGISTYSGGTTVSEGILQVYNASGGTGATTVAALGSTAAAVSVSSGATLWLDYLVGSSSNTVTYANNFSGAGTVKVTAPGAIAAGASQLSGNLSGLTGTLDLFPNSGSLGRTEFSNTTSGAQPASSATIKVESGTTLYLWTGLTYASSFQIYSTGSAENLGALRIESGTAVSGSVTLMANGAVGSNLGTGTISGVISDGGHGYSLTTEGSGAITLANANTYSGGTALSAGQLNINNAGALGTGTFTISGGTTIDNTSGGLVTNSNNNVQTWSGDFTFSGTNALDLGTGAVTLGGNRQVTVNANALLVGGNIGDGGNTYSITKAGGGTLELGGASSYSGGTTVSAGTVQVYNAAGGTSSITPTTLGSTSSSVTVASGATLWLDYLLGATANNVTYAYAFGGAGTVKVTAPGTGNPWRSTSILSGNLSALTGTLDVFPISGTTGKTELSDTTNGHQPSASATIKVESGTTLFIPTGLTYGSKIQLYSTGNVEGLGALRLESGTVVSGNVTLMANASIGSNSGSGTVSGIISDGGNGYLLTKQGGGTSVLTGANSYTGGTVLSSGTLSFASGALSTGNITFSGSSTLQWNGTHTQDVSGKIQGIGSGVTATFDTNGNNVSFGSALSGAGAIAKAGSGALTLSAANVFTGGATLSAGTLNINNASALGTGTFTISGGTIDNTSGGAIVLSTNNAEAWNSDFTFTGTGSLNMGTGAVTLGGSRAITIGGGVFTVGGAIGDGGSGYAITKLGAGTLVMYGSSTYSGGTNVNAGVVQVGNLINPGTNPTSNTMLGTGNVTVTSATLQFYTQAGGATVYVNNFANNFTLGGAGVLLNYEGSNQLNGTVTVTGTNNFLQVTFPNKPLTIAGTLAGTGAVTIQGAANPFSAGDVYITGAANSYSGTMTLDETVNKGVQVEVGANGSLANATVVINGSVPNNASGGSFLLGGTALVFGAGVTSPTIGMISGSGNFTLETQDTAALPVALTVGGNNGSATYSGAISDGGIGGSLMKSGSGTLTLSGANAFTGGMMLSAGQLNLNNAAAVGTGTFTINGGAIDNTSGGAITLNNNAQVWGGNFSFVGSNNLNLGTGAVSLSGNRVVTVSGGVLTVGGVISGAGKSLTKAGAGALVLSGANTFSGGMVLTAGELDINNASAIGTGAFTINGGTIDNTSGAAITLSNNNTETWAGSFTFAGSNDLNLGTGAISLTGDATVTDPAKTLTVGGNISGAHSLAKSGAGTMTLSGNNSYSNGMTLVSGCLNVNSASALGTGTFTIDGGTIDNTSGGAVTLNNNAETWAGSFTFLGTGILNLGTGAISLAASTTITVAASVLAIGGAISGGFALNKAGSGNETVTGASTYSGGTTLSAGVLYVNNASGSGLGTGAVTVSGGTLAGTGSISGSIAVNSGGTLGPGVGGPSAFGSGSVTIASGGTFDVDVNSSTAGSGYDQLNVTGTVSLTGSTLHLHGTRASHGGDTIVLINNDGSDAVSGTFTGLAEGALVSLNGVNYTLSYHGGTGNDVVLTDAAPTVATGASAAPSTVTGSTTALSVLGATSNGESTLTYSWSATSRPASSNPSFSVNGSNGAKNTTVTFDKAGSYTFQVTISDGTYTTTSSVSVTVNQTLTTITVTPGSATLNENGTQQFTATGYDQFGDAMATQPTFTWTKVSGVGAVDSNGLYAAPYGVGSAVIKAASGSVSNTASITVNNAAPTIAVHASATASPVTGLTTGLSVLGADDGGESNLVYTWSVTSQPASSSPTLSINGTNAAKNATVTFNKAGNYTFQVTIDDGTSQATDSVNVTVSQTLTSIAITPASATIHENATQQFSATAYDQFGIALAVQPTFTWSVASGVGSVDRSGLYTAPSGTGTAVVQAASGGVSNTVNVTVNNAAPTVATAASASPSTITGLSSALSVLGADDGGENNLTYTWSTTSQPASSNPGFSINGTNGAKNTTVTFDKAGSYTFQVTIDDGVNHVTSSVNVTVSQTLTSIAVTPGSATLTENATQQFSATAYDQFHSTMASQPSFTWSLASGVGSVDGNGLYRAPYGTGSAVVKAASGGVNNTASITVNNAAPTVAVHATAAPSPVTGTTTALSVLGADDGGESNLVYTWSVTSGPASSHPALSINGTNAAKNTTVTFDKAGSYTFQVTIDDGTSQITDSVTVAVNQTLTSITLSPASATLNEQATQQFTATGYDQFGTTMATQPSFTWTKTSGVGAVDSNGLYSAPYGTGSATIKASSGGVNNTASITVNNAAPTIVTHASATSSPVTGLTAALSVLGADDGGEGHLTYSWSALGTPPASVSFSVNGTNGAKNTTVTFTKAGNYSFLVTIDDGTNQVTDTVNVTVNQTLTTITLSPASATLNEQATQQFSATGYDQFGMALATQPVFTWTKVSGVGAMDSSGFYTAPSGTGSAVIKASSGGVSQTASISVNNAAPTVATHATAAPSPVTGLTTALSVLGADDGGENNLTYTWSVTSQPASSNPALSINGTNAAKNTTVTFDKAGNYSFQVTISDGTSQVTDSVTVVVNQTLTTITVLPASATLNEQATQQFSATAYDQFHAVMATQPTFTWTKTSGVGTLDSSGLYTAPSGTGLAVIKASSGSVNNTASITVNNAAPTIVTPAAATPAPVTSTTTALSVLGADDGGESNLTYNWSLTSQPAFSNPIFSINSTNAAKNTLVTFDKAGSYTFQVTIDDGTNQVTSSVTVQVNQTLTTIAVTPGSATLNENASQQFTAAGYDQFGASMATQPTFTWSKTSGTGAIDSNGLYTAPYGTGSAVIQATSGSVSNTATITINNAAPTLAGHAAATPSPVTGLTTALSVLGADDGGESHLTYSWSTLGTPPAPVSFSVNGTNGAKNTTVSFAKAGNYSFQVTIDDGANQVTDTVSVTVSQTLMTLAITPGSSGLNENAIQQFSATGYDQFGDAMATQPTFTWTKTSGVGAVDSSGLYTAPSGTGLAVIKASSGSVSNTASITVNNAAPTIVTHAAANPTPVTGLTTALSVLGADDGGESNLVYTWSVTSQPASSSPTLSINGTNAAKNTVVTFDKAGSYTFQVTIDDGTNQMTDSVLVVVNQTLTTITISPASATLNEQATQQFMATGYDQFGMAMATQPAFTWSKIAGVGTLDSSGFYTAPSSAGSATIKAASGSISNTVSVTISNAAPTIITHAAANPSPAAGLSAALSVLAADDGGENNLTYTWSTTSQPASSNPGFSINGTNGSKNTTVTFDKAGNYTFQVTIDDGASQITDSVSIVVNQTLTTINVTPGSATLKENDTESFVATGYDQFGASMAATFSWSKVSGVGAIDGSGLYTAPYGTGTAMIRAASGGVSTMASITVNNAAPAIATHAAASPAPVTGLSTALSALGTDDGGENNLTYTWSAISQPASIAPTFSINGTNGSKNTTVTFDEAGIYTFQVTIDDGTNQTTDTVSVTVNQTLTTITVSPASASLNENGTQQLSATAYDQFDNAMATQPAFTWTLTSGVGSVDSHGLYTAPYAAGSAVVQAASGGINSTASLTVTNAVPSVATAASASASAVTGKTTSLSVLGADDGGESNLTYTWSLTSQPASSTAVFSANATNAAKSTTVTFDRSGSYTFLVTIDDGMHQAISSVTVTVNQTLTTIVVTPGSASLNENATAQFSAAGYDQFGMAMVNQPSFIWSKVSGIGGIDSNGLYTAPYGTGAATLQAVSGSVSKTVNLTITNAAPTIITHAAVNPAPVTGLATTLSVLADDDGGESNLVYTWSVISQPASSGASFSSNGSNTSKNTTVTFDKAGNYTFLVTIDDGAHQITDTVSVSVNQTLTSIVVTPGAVNVPENATQQFTATGYDQFGIAMATQPSFTWSKTAGVGVIDSSGLYTAPYGTGSATVQAVSGTVSNTASIALNNAAPTIAMHASATPSPVTGLTTALSVLGADDGGESNLVYTWSLTAGPTSSNPAFSINGTNAAKNTTVTFDHSGTYSFQVTINDGMSQTTDSVTVSVNQTLTTIAILPGSATLQENATQQLRATAVDQFGIAMISQPTFTWSKFSGVGAIDSNGLYTAPYSTGAALIEATSGGVSQTVSISVNNAAPTLVTHAAANPTPVTGVTTALSVLGADDGGESNLRYNWSTLATPPAPVSFSVNGTNGAKNTTVTFTKAGTYSFQVTIDDGSQQATDTVSVVVNQTLTTITVTPGSAALNENGTQQFTVAGYDQFGAAMATQPSFTWTKVSGVGAVDSNGLYAAPYGVGSAVIKAASGSVSNTASITVNNAAPTIAVHASATASPVTGLTTGLSVLGADDGGESNLVYTWSVTSQPASSSPTLSINGTNAAKNATVTFNKAGNYTFQVTIDDGTSQATDSVNVTVSQTLTSIAITPASATIHENATQQFSATAYDQFGIALAVQPTFTWSVASGVGSVDRSGLYTAPSGTGTAVVQAASGGVSNTVNVTVNNAAPTVATAASASPSTITGLSSALSVLGADDGGENNLTYTWSTTSQPASSNPGFSINGTNGAKNTTVTFDKAGSYTFQVTIDDGVNHVTSSVNVTVSQTLTSIAVTPGSATLTENATQQFSATAYDQFHSTMASQPSFTWSLASGVGSVDGNGLYRAPYGTGSAVVKAASGGVNNTASITVNNAAPTVAVHATAAPSPVTGTTTALSVLGADDGGESNLVYTWSVTSGPASSHPALSINGTNAAKNTTVTFDKAGSYTFQVTIDDGTSQITDSVTVAVNQTLTSITLSPASATLNEQATQQFTATGYDQFGTTMATQPSFTWTKTSGVGAVDSNGLYSAPYGTGSATIKASSGGVNNTASITVNNAAPTIVTHASATSSPVTGLTAALSVLGADDGGEGHLTYSWSALGTPPASVSFSVNGTNGAKNTTVTFTKAGNYSFLVTIDDGTNQVTDTVNVTVNQTLTTITLSPASATLNEQATQQFSATGYDQFGMALATQPVFTWTKVSGVGAMDSSGFYTAPSGTGSAVIKASSGGVSQTASISVNNAAPTVATHATAAPSPVTGLTTALSVLGADDGGENNLTYTWSVTSQPASSNPALSINGTNAAKNTTVTFDKAGNYSFQVTISDGTSQVTDSVTVVVNQTLTTITVLPASATLNEQATQQFSATAYDQFHAVMATQPTFTWTKTSGVGTLDSSGLYTAPSGTGLAVIKASSGSVNNTASITVNNAAPTIVTPAAATPAPVTSTTTALSVLGADDGGESNLTYNWSLTSQPAFSNPIFSINSTNAAKNTLVTFDKAGSYTFQVTIDDGTNQVTSSVTVQVNQTLTTIAVTPGSATLNENASQQFTAAGYDQFGASMATQPTFTWSKTSGTGAIDSNGLYTAPYGTGTAVIQAGSGSVSKTATITINNAPPTIVNHAGADSNPAATLTTNLSVLAADDGAESFLTYTWSILGNPPAPVTFSANGTNAAKNTTPTFAKAGTYTFQVAVSDGTNITLDTVTVTVNQTPTTLTISPISAALNDNQSTLFTAALLDQFGDPLSLAPALTWSLDSGSVGTISATGNFNAGIMPGTATVRATAGALTATVNVTVSRTAPTISIPATASSTVINGTSTSLHVSAQDDGSNASLTYAWSAASVPANATPVFSINGTNAASETLVTFDEAGVYTFLVTVSNGVNTATSSVTLTVNQTLSLLTVSAKTTTVSTGTPAQFTAAEFDQFNDPMANPVPVRWTTTDNNTIDAAGTFNARSSGASATVIASTGSLQATAAVTLDHPAPPPPPLAPPVFPDQPPTTPPSQPAAPPATPITSITPATPITPVLPITSPATPPTTGTGGETSSTPSLPSTPSAPSAPATPAPVALAPVAPALSTPAAIASSRAPSTPNNATNTPLASSSIAGPRIAGSSGIASTPHPTLNAMLPTALAEAPAPVSAAPVDVEQLIHDAPHAPTAPHPFPGQAVEQIKETAKHAAERQNVVHRVVGTIATVSAAASAGYLLWIARGGSLLMSMLTSVPIWRFLDPLPVLNATTAKARKKRWWHKKKLDPITDPSDEQLEQLMD